MGCFFGCSTPSPPACTTSCTSSCVPCESHFDCTRRATDCYAYGEDKYQFCYAGTCAPCSECHVCSDGIDNTCGTVCTGIGYPSQESGTCEKGTGACNSHSECAGSTPFCYEGRCAPCSECHHCHDGIDDTCGPCGSGYPTDGATCSGNAPAGPWNMEYTLSGQDMVIMLLVFFNMLTVFAVICNCVRSRCGKARNGQKYQVVTMDKAMAAESDSEEEQLKNEAM